MPTNDDIESLKEFCGKSHLPILDELLSLRAIRDASGEEVSDLRTVICSGIWSNTKQKQEAADVAVDSIVSKVFFLREQLREAREENNRLHDEAQVSDSLVLTLQEEVKMLTKERDEARKEVAWQKKKVRNLQMAADSAGRVDLLSQIATLTTELAALKSAPQMAEVNALWAMWLKTRPPEDEPVVEDLVDLARQTILAYEREKRRADEAEKEARRVECCTCGHEMVEVDGQFGCEHCDHEYDQTCECPNCHQTRERESAQSRIATLTSERDELESMRKEDIKAVLCLQSEIERLLAKVEHKKQQLEIDAVCCRSIAAREEVVGLLKHILSCIITVKQENTPEWMEYIAEEVNKINEAIGDPDRVVVNCCDIVIVRGKSEIVEGK